MGLMDPETHKIRLNNAQCATCLGRPGVMPLRPGRIRELIRANTGDGRMGLVCHATIDYRQGDDPEYGGDQALCRWFFDRFGHLVNGVRVMLRLGGFTEVDPPPAKEGTPVATELSGRESAVLRIIEAGSGLNSGPATRDVIACELRNSSIEVTAASVSAIAGSLVRKGLVYRAGTSKMMWYRVTEAGQQALTGDQAGQWVARASLPAVQPGSRPLGHYLPL